jgi:hypothetical protein
VNTRDAGTVVPARNFSYEEILKNVFITLCTICLCKRNVISI